MRHTGLCRRCGHVYYLIGCGMLTLPQLEHLPDDHVAHGLKLLLFCLLYTSAKILSKTVINPDEENFAQNQYFYDAAEGVLTAVILLLAEYLPPKRIHGELRERRHIVSVFKLVQAVSYTHLCAVCTPT